MCLELGFVWLVYFVYGLAADHDMPIWLTAFMVLMVDRIVTFITTKAQEKRERIAERSLGNAPAP